MQLQDAIELGINLINNGTKHSDYQKTVDLAAKYLTLSTGEGIELLLQRFVKREDEEMFRQRLAITKSITPAVCESLESPWNKVIRNERVKKGLDIKNPANEERIQAMTAGFFGSDRNAKTTKGLEYWMKTRLFELTFADPNAWIAVEWDPVAGATEVLRPRPFEIPSAHALNFSVVNDETKWLFSYQDIKMKVSVKAEVKPIDGKRYTLYDTDFTVVFEQIDIRFLNSTDPQRAGLADNQILRKIGSLWFVISAYTPNLGFAPVFRIGYKRDRATNSRTFVNPWHKALAFLEKSLKTVSELDLTTALHSFPQKLQYAYACPGEEKDPCKKGRLRNGSVCGTCRGTGYKFHTSAQDAMLLTMPDDPKDMIDLDKIIVYKAPPIDLVRWQNEYVQQLKIEAKEAVFNASLLQKKNGGGGQGAPAANGPVTATEIDTNMQSIYDALEPFTEKFSEIFREFVTVFALLCGESLADVKVVHNFPADYKLKTMDILLADLKSANDSSGPSFLRDAINMDLAEIIYSGDELGLLKYRTKRKFFPFNGKATDEIQFLMSLSIVAEREKILYANFEAIFQELEAENPDFYAKPETKQSDLLEEKIAEWMEALNAEQPTLKGIGDIAGEGDAVNPLKTSVGGLTGMIEIAKAVASGVYDLEAAVALVSDRFGLTPEEARKQLGKPSISGDTEIEKVVQLT